MVAYSTYSTGTVTIAAGATIVTGIGTGWTETDVVSGDLIQIDTDQPIEVSDLTDATHLTLWAPWAGANKTSVAYKIIKQSSKRYNASQTMMDVSQIVATMNTDGYYYYVKSTETVPNPSYGNEGQFAMQATTGKLWLKQGGIWVFVGVNKGFGLPLPWSGATAYNAYDVVSIGGSTYVCILAHTNHTPPNATYWTLLASIGQAATVAVGTVTTLAGGATATVSNSGTSGAAVLDFGIPQGKNYIATSGTSNTVGTGTDRTFMTQANLAYLPGARVRASSNSAPTNWIEGVASYSGTTLVITPNKSNGSGTFTDWNFNIAGEPGAGDLSSANNLSDVADVALARINLGIGGIRVVASIKDYGAKGDGRTATATVTIASGSAALGAAGAGFTALDVNKLISIPGAGPSGRPLLSRILSFTDADHVTLYGPASTSLSAVSKDMQIATDDTAAINAMILAVNYGASGHIYFPKGFYGFSTLNQLDAPCVFQGTGSLTSVLQSFVDSGDLIVLAGTKQTWRDLGLTCAGTRLSGVSLKTLGNQCLIENFDITNAYVAYENSGVLNSLSFGNINMITSRNIAAGSGCVRNIGTILSCVGVGMGSGTLVAADMCEFGFEVKVGELDLSQCFVFLVNHGCKVDPGSGQTVLGVNLKGCWFDSTLTSGLYCTPGHASAVLQLVWASDCWFGPGFGGGASYAVVLDNSIDASFTRAWLSNNYLISYNHAAGVGLYVKGGTNDLELNFNNNTVGGSGQAFSVGVQMLSNTSVWSVTDNSINNNTVGVSIAVGCNYYVLADNRILFNGTSVSNAALAASVKSITGNLGYKLSGTGEVVQAPASGLVTIPHGLDAAPSVWTGQVRSTAFVLTQPYSADATNIVFILFDQSGAHTTGSQIIQWRADA